MVDGHSGKIVSFVTMPVKNNIDGGGGHPQPEGVGAEEEVVAGHPEPEGVGEMVGHPELEGVGGHCNCHLELEVGGHHHPDLEVVGVYLRPEGEVVAGYLQVHGHTKEINNDLLLETQFTFFIAPVQAHGYCMQII